jgi:hypothetical protein
MNKRNTIIDLEEEQEKIIDLSVLRAYQLQKTTKRTLKPKGIIEKRCPKCGEYLFGGRISRHYKYFICTHCFYDWSKRIRFSLLNSMASFAYPGASREVLEYTLKLEGKDRGMVEPKEIATRLLKIRSLL